MNILSKNGVKMSEITVKNFSNISQNGQVLSPLPHAYPNTPLPDEIKKFTDEKTHEIEGESSLSKRWDLSNIINTDDNTFQNIFLASSTTGKLSRLLIDYKNLLTIDGLGSDNQKQWKNATLLKTANTLKELLEQNVHNALNEVEQQKHLSNDTSKKLAELSVTASYINEEIIRSILSFMERHPDAEYENGDKRDHFLFETPTSKGGQYHLADIRHGNTQDQCLLVVEGAKLANKHRLTLPDFSEKTENLPTQDSFNDLIKSSLFGKENNDDTPTL